MVLLRLKHGLQQLTPLVAEGFSALVQTVWCLEHRRTTPTTTSTSI